MQILKLDEVMQKTRMSRSKIYEFLDAGKFPRPIKIGRLNGWIEDEINAWIRALVEERDAA